MEALRVGKFTMLLAVMLLGVGVCFAEDNKPEKDIWAEEIDTNASQERITELLRSVAKKDVELAGRLAKLRYEDPKQFWTELREKGFLKSSRPAIPKDQAAVNREKKQNEEYFAWVQKNFKEELGKLQRIKENNPKIYDRHLSISRKRYGKIMEIQKMNAPLAEVMKQDVLLSKKRNELVSRIKYATDDKHKQKLIAELSKVIAARFEVIVKKKQIQYEALEKNLERLKKRIATQKAETQKLIDKKDQATKDRVKELLSDAEKVNWK